MAAATAGRQDCEQLHQRKKPNTQNAENIQQIKLEILAGQAKVVWGFVDQWQAQGHCRYQYQDYQS